MCLVGLKVRLDLLVVRRGSVELIAFVRAAVQVTRLMAMVELQKDLAIMPVAKLRKSLLIVTKLVGLQTCLLMVIVTGLADYRTCLFEAELVGQKRLLKVAVLEWSLQISLSRFVLSLWAHFQKHQS